jgi:FkbM family methyltransferase
VDAGANLACYGPGVPLRRRTPQVSAAQFFELAYGRAPSAEEQALLDRLVPSVSSASDARAVLLAFDQQQLPTTFQVRLGDDDLALASLDGFRLWLDRRDVSVSAVILDRQRWEPHIEAVLRDVLRPGDTFVDVGANVGYHTFLAASLVGASGRVVAFEPDAENCRLLWLSRAENGFDHVTIVPNALDRSAGLRYLATHLGSNGGLVETELDAVRRGRGVFVQAQRLDDLVSAPVRLMKVDVEGAELSVLAGAERLLGSSPSPPPSLVLEFSVEMTQRVSGVSPEPALERLLDDYGYRLSVLDRESPGRRIPYPSAAALLADWGDPLRIEDLLLER